MVRLGAPGVRQVKVLSEHSLLVEAAVDGLQHWRCLLNFQDGQPVAVSAQAHVGFSLPE